MSYQQTVLDKKVKCFFPLFNKIFFVSKSSQQCVGIESNIEQVRSQDYDVLTCT